MNNILVISNGHGEDIIASYLIKELIKRDKDISINVFPIVGTGKSFQGLPVKIVGPQKKMPSGGFMRNSLKNFLIDIRGGLIGLTISQIKFMRNIKKDIDSVIVVGDIFVLLLAGYFINKKTVFLPTAKSEYIDGHYWIENKIMKKKAGKVFPRDKKTAEALSTAGVNAEFVGNAMMDCFNIKGTDFQLENKKTIGILPGSRIEAYDNMIDILKVIEYIEKQSSRSYNYIAAMASNIEVDELTTKIEDTEWMILQNNSEKENGINLKIVSPEGKSTVKFVYHHFGDVLVQSDIFIGLAGTANEQAAGMGKPVVTFPGTGTQFTEKFAHDQKSLLGEGVALVERDFEKVASTVISILENKEIYNLMSSAGRKRMGKPGGIKRMVDIIFKYLNIS